LKLNFHKSKIFFFDKAKEEDKKYRRIFGCEVGSLPFKYLGTPSHYRKLQNIDWELEEDRFEQKFALWLGKLLTYGHNLALINFVLTSLPMFLLSLFQIPKLVRKKLDFYRSRLFGKVMG
jgi:hypothetical protein